jgi:hypothetical protein
MHSFRHGHPAHRTTQGQRFIAVTSREPSDPEGKLMRMKSGEHVGAEAGAIRVISVSAEQPVGMGFGDRFGGFRGGSGSSRGRVLQADKPGKMQGKRASTRRSHIT